MFEFFVDTVGCVGGSFDIRAQFHSLRGSSAEPANANPREQPCEADGQNMKADT